MDPDLKSLLYIGRVRRVALDLFAHTDARDWAKVRQCFAARVHFDMTSLTGGSPTELTPAQITEGWDEGLRTLTAVHHQIGNLRVDVDDSGRATVQCYGTATHYHPDPRGNTRTFLGEYELGLIQGTEG